MITIKVTTECFAEILSGNKKSVKHGFSKNKKYTGLFLIKENESINLRNENTGEKIIRTFKKINISETNGNKYFEIEFV